MSVYTLAEQVIADGARIYAKPDRSNRFRLKLEFVSEQQARALIEQYGGRMNERRGETYDWWLYGRKALKLARELRRHSSLPQHTKDYLGDRMREAWGAETKEVASDTGRPALNAGVEAS